VPDVLTPAAQGLQAPGGATTSGLHVAAWQADRLPDGVRMSAHALTTEDGVAVTGFLFRRGGERTVVCSMHPREMNVTHYLVPEVLAGGCAMWLMGARSVGNDLRLEHEAAVLDLAAGQRFLEAEGYAQRVLLGASGGGALAAFYNQQSLRIPSQRIRHSPGGRPSGLESATLPVAEALVFVSAHLGQGVLLMNSIDPSLSDEDDAFSMDPALSLFEPENGFRPPPQSSHFAPQFLERYRAAQRVRVERIDHRARRVLERREAARLRQREGRGASTDAAVAAHAPVLAVWRTDAEPRCYDLSLDPSQRSYGSLFGTDPLASNYGSTGFARLCTAESWLSNWSGLSSNATMQRCAPTIAQSTLMIEYSGDNAIFPSDADRLYGYIGASDKQRERVLGRHQGQPVHPGQPNGQPEAGRLIREWLLAKGFG